MTKPFFYILLCSALLAFGTACISSSPVQYDYSIEQSGGTLDCRAGDLITVTLPADNTADAFWKDAAPVNQGVLLRLDIKQGKALRKGESIPEKVVQFRYRVINAGYSGISIEYKSTDVRTPKKRFDLLVRAEGKPMEFEDLFKDGPPPETMTDSKGNIVPKPKHLLERSAKDFPRRTDSLKTESTPRP